MTTEQIAFPEYLKTKSIYSIIFTPSLKKKTDINYLSHYKYYFGCMAHIKGHRVKD